MSSAASTGITSPPPAYVHTPPMKLSPVSTRHTQGGSATSSTIAVDQHSTGQMNGTIDPNKHLDKYEDWYPADASHDGRPAWWNRLFCCGYGLGCLLCPCGSATCKQERA